LFEEEKQYTYLQQDNTTAHSTQYSMEALPEVFGYKIIS
jgi:hypothetical protein